MPIFSAALTSTILVILFGLVDVGFSHVPVEAVPIGNAILQVIVVWMTSAGIQYKSKQK